MQVLVTDFSKFSLARAHTRAFERVQHFFVFLVANVRSTIFGACLIWNINSRSFKEVNFIYEYG